MKVPAGVWSAVLIAVLLVPCAYGQNEGIRNGAGTATFTSEQGDFIGGSRRAWSVAPNQGIFTSSLQADFNGNPIGIRIVYLSFPEEASATGTTWIWNFTAGTEKGKLGPGAFADAIRAPFSNDANGLEVIGDGRGCNTLTGTFTITTIEWNCLPDDVEHEDTELHLTSFAATFEQHCEGAGPSLKGTFSFTSEGGVACDGSGGGGDGGGDSGGPSENPVVPPPVRIALPSAFDIDPLVMGNSSTETIHFSTETTDPTFAGDLNLFATSDAADWEDFHVEVTPSHIPSPGIGDATLKIITGPTTFPRNYLVTVTGVSGGITTSSTMVVSITCDPPVILGINQPKNITAANGAQVTLEVKPSGTGPFTYQWFKGFPGMTRSPVLAANEAKLIFTTRETATYWARVSNACGTVNTNGATVTTTGTLAGPARRRGSGN